MDGRSLRISKRKWLGRRTELYRWRGRGLSCVHRYHIQETSVTVCDKSLCHILVTNLLVTVWASLLDYCVTPMYMVLNHLPQFPFHLCLVVGTSLYNCQHLYTSCVHTNRIFSLLYTTFYVQFFSQCICTLSQMHIHIVFPVDHVLFISFQSSQLIHTHLQPISNSHMYHSINQ